MEKEWIDQAQRLIALLGLRGSPVAVTYSLEPDPRAMPGRYWVCQALQEARGGAILDLTPQTSACNGGTFHLGLGPRPTGEADRALKKFLIQGEKLFCSLATVQRLRSLTLPPPLGLADHVLFAPLERAEKRPDLVVFAVNPEQACRLLTLATFMDGVPPRTESMGASCYTTITYPLLSGEINISLLDYTARRVRRFAAEELFLTIPYFRISNLMESIPYCSAGTAPIEVLPEFHRFLDHREEISRPDSQKEEDHGEEMAG